MLEKIVDGLLCYLLVYSVSNYNRLCLQRDLEINNIYRPIINVFVINGICSGKNEHEVEKANFFWYNKI